jgi:hypothetical protein
LPKSESSESKAMVLCLEAMQASVMERTLG